MRCLAGSGAEILMPEIHWPVHLQQALLAGFRPVFYKLDEHFAPDPESIRRAAGPATRVLLLNTPANPTGAVSGLPLQQTLYEIADERGWQIISDEAYEDFAFSGPTCPSPPWSATAPRRSASSTASSPSPRGRR